MFEHLFEHARWESGKGKGESGKNRLNHRGYRAGLFAWLPAVQPRALSFAAEDGMPMKATFAAIDTAS
jgi:hypothetical protein